MQTAIVFAYIDLGELNIILCHKTADLVEVIAVWPPICLSQPPIEGLQLLHATQYSSGTVQKYDNIPDGKLCTNRAHVCMHDMPD